MKKHGCLKPWDDGSIMNTAAFCEKVLVTERQAARFAQENGIKTFVTSMPGHKGRFRVFVDSDTHAFLTGSAPIERKTQEKKRETMEEYRERHYTVDGRKLTKVYTPDFIKLIHVRGNNIFTATIDRRHPNVRRTVFAITSNMDEPVLEGAISTGNVAAECVVVGILKALMGYKNKNAR